MTVGLVLVSHSSGVADGTAALAAQMAPSVRIAAAGGSDDGGIGTSFDKISAALQNADTGDGAVILYDLGSALLTTETAIEFAEADQVARWRVVDAPLVEGAIAAAVTAEGGGDLAAVAVAAAEAGLQFGAGPARQAGQASSGGPAEAVDGATTGAQATADDGTEPAVSDVQVVNPLGLHARPAAQLARALAGTSVTALVGRPAGPAIDLRSVLGVVRLALRGGDTVRISVSGTDRYGVLRRLTDLIRGGFGEAGQAPPEPAGTATAARVRDGTAQATGGAPGRALGPLARLGGLPEALSEAVPGVDGGVGGADGASDSIEHTAQQQALRLEAAIAAAADHLAGQGEFGQAHAALVADPALRAAAGGRLDQGAARAWWSAITEAASELEGSADELVAARAVDLREAGLQVLGELGVRIDRIGPGVAGAVVVTPDLGPAEVPALVEHGAVAAVLSAGSTTAHAVIVARGLGFPMVLRAGSALDDIAAGTMLLVDGDAGSVRIDPPEAGARAAREAIAAEQDAATELRAAAAAPVTGPDGRQILVAANVGSVADARAAVENGADGIGLLRTELLVLDRPRYPDEDTQTADLAAILEVLGERPVVIRVLDAGGDKPVNTLAVTKEHNGFLGVRGLRYLLRHPDLLRTQLRAICRAGAGHRVSVMAPMVTVRPEAEAFRTAVDDAVRSLIADGVAHEVPEGIGIMVEVPAAALAADQFAGVVDFFSVGSNDLISYTMAAERTEPGVADLLDPGSPPVQRLLDQLCAAARASGIPVAVCGEMAAMPEHVWPLVDRGVTELSMAPARIPQIKALLRSPAPRHRA
jgi:dihydroxyacetone kinase phosphotransfer subunit